MSRIFGSRVRRVGVSDRGAPVGSWSDAERVELSPDALVSLSTEELRTLRSSIDAALEEEPALRVVEHESDGTSLVAEDVTTHDGEPGAASSGWPRRVRLL